MRLENGPDTWREIESRENSDERLGVPCGASRARAKELFLAFLRTIPLHDIVLYTDGSRQPSGAAGAGFVAYQGGVQILQRSLHLGTGLEVFDIEAQGALAGAKAVLELESTKFATDLWICLDNLEVARHLLSPFTGSSQTVFNEFLSINPTWQSRYRLPHTRRGAVRIRWVPGHTLIPGNEAADKAAREGSLHRSSINPRFSLAGLKRWAKTEARQASEKLWMTLLPQLEIYHQLSITSAPHRPKELELPRSILSRILASRSGHGDFASYHERFKHKGALLYCRCGRRKSPLHFFFCNIAKKRARRPSGPPSEIIPYLLGTYKGGILLGKWLEETKFHSDICPTHLPSPI